jgi:hypothetical protein
MAEHPQLQLVQIELGTDTREVKAVQMRERNLAAVAAVPVVPVEMQEPQLVEVAAVERMRFPLG